MVGFEDYIKNYFKLISIACMVPGGLAGIVVAFLTNRFIGFIIGFLAVLVASIIAITLIYVFDLLKRIVIYKKYSLFNLLVEQDILLPVNCGFEIKNENIDNMLNMRRFEREAFRKIDGQIMFTSKSRGKSFENICISLVSNQNGCFLRLISKPSRPKLIYDCARNLENVSIIKDSLTRRKQRGQERPEGENPEGENPEGENPEGDRHLLMKC